MGPRSGPLFQAILYAGGAPTFPLIHLHPPPGARLHMQVTKMGD